MCILLKQKKHVFALFLSAVFLLLQTSAQLHATDHYFHTADEICATYKSVENNSSGFVSNKELNFDWQLTGILQADISAGQVVLDSYQPQQTRAPPSIYL